MTRSGTNFNEHAPLIRAVVFSPNANGKSNLNCSVIVIATVGDSLFLARELAMAFCRISPGAIIEISEVDETNTAEYLETVDGYEVAA